VDAPIARKEEKEEGVRVRTHINQVEPVRTPMDLLRLLDYDEQSELNVLVTRMMEELAHAMDTHSEMHSAHEGYAIILEELDELWELVRKKVKNHDKKKMQKEALHVAAMAIRFTFDFRTPGEES
jgi:hypothetical protein